MSKEKKEKRAWVLRDNVTGFLLGTWIGGEPSLPDIRKAAKDSYTQNQPKITVKLSDEPGPEHCRRYRLTLVNTFPENSGKSVRLLTVETTPLRA